ncbi:MAG: HEAT repeat domain-containing protein [Planctomycetota bacterium]|nr:HEAT repeat domain-containing protein [Planctomycetota bacterium]
MPVRALRNSWPIALGLLLAAAGVFAGEDPAPEPYAVGKILGVDVAGWVAHLEGHDLPEERQKAVYCLGEFGPEAAPAVPALTKLLDAPRDPLLRRLAVEALGHIGPRALPALGPLLQCLSDEKAALDLRAAACAAAARIAPAQPPVAEAVLALLRSGDPELRHAAFGAAVTVYFQGNMEAWREQILERLARAVRTAADAPAAALALRCLGERGAEILVEAFARAERPAAQLEILGALERMGPLAKGRAEKLLLLAVGSRHDPDTWGPLLRALAAADLLGNYRPGIYANALGDPKAGADAEEILLRCGAAGVPSLKEALEDPKAAPARKIAALRVLARLGSPGADPLDAIVAQLKDPAPAVRRAAVAALNQLGPYAKAAADRIAGRVVEADDPAERAELELALANVTRAPEREPIRSVYEVRRDASVRQALAKEPDPRRRAEAAAALFGRTEQAEANAEALLAALENPDVEVKVAAARSLGFYGEHARRAVPILADWLGGDDPARHRAALAAFAALGAEAEPAVPNMAAFAQREAADDERTLELLGLALKPHGVQAGPWLSRALKRDDPAVACRVAKAIRVMGPAGATTLNELFDLACGADDAAAEAALLAIGSMGDAAKEAVKPLIELLTWPLPERRMAAAWALGDLGLGAKTGDPNAARVIEALVAGVLDAREPVARAAHSGLVAVGQPAVAPLRELLKLDEHEAPYWVLRVLARLKADPDLVVPRMLKLTLPGMLPLERGTMAELLGNYAPEHEEMIPVLIRVLGDREDFVARAAGRTLALFGNKSVPWLEAAVRAPDPRARRHALAVLEELRRK